MSIAPEPGSVSDILVVSAGPVGLTAALELARRGNRPRIIDRAAGPSEQSRALAVNPRTLDIFEPSGVTETLLATGLRIDRMEFVVDGHKLFAVDMARLEHRYNFMLVVPQAKTERIIIERLAALDIKVNWNTEFLDVTQESARHHCTLRKGNETGGNTCDILIGCDGIGSDVRDKLGIGFDGSTRPDAWALADVTFTDPPPANVVSLHALDNAMLGIIPVEDTIYRLVTTMPEIPDRLPGGLKIASIVWSSQFRISNRQVETYQRGSAFLCGDAAHVHSPVGGRGMNLGIEDAATLAHLIAEGETEHYSELRHAVGAHVLSMTEMQTRLLTSGNPVTRFLRRHMLPWIIKRQWVQRRLLAEMSGLAVAAPEWLNRPRRAVP